ncbi:hypothetical protein [Hymenobacter cellulosilyticus]|uniref:Uncharacterized protein n=1 Tax=Hymenobacter cellulosilyticus TaxID=2932248 RepID=A0A8T9Q0F5_9BACT|nr:hypothetical protein [Hymenobacter cellulosilyticus]UOQ71256.1 hypothetical protein MUN79_21790 [Hymenobacter cellulosilyticus]
MFFNQPQQFAYHANTSAEALRATADVFIARQGGPLHPHVYRASWQSATVLEVAPLVALGGLRFSGKQRATLEIGAAATGTPVMLTVYPAPSMQPMFWGITLFAALAGFFDLGQTHWLHVGFSLVFWTLGSGSLWVLHRVSTGLLKRDLERSFQLAPLT